ncbi:MAG: leucine-rich repeat protein, partial [Prevotellaceae bacterium]|nr:leucine-rich repeat protein [Prevotellaceae bacterium]
MKYLNSILTIFFCLTIVIGTSAQNFSAQNNGKTIYYRITSANAPHTVAVTYNGASAEATNEYNGNIEIPESVTNSGTTYSVTSIDSVAFLGCTGLTAVTIPAPIKAIYGSAFKGCTSLVTVNFNATNCEYMGFTTSAVFSGATAFTTLNIGINVRRIPNNAFRGCAMLNLPTFPNAVEIIGRAAFYGCSAMSGMLNLPPSLTMIGNNAFYSCTGLINSLVLPQKLKYINNNAFLLCTGFTGAVVLPDSIVFIGPAPFAGCSGLIAGTETLTIPEKVDTLDISAFQGFSNLKTINFNAHNCTKMGDDTTTLYVFGACNAVETINIGAEVTKIPGRGFAGLSSVQYIKSDAVTPPQIGANTFFRIPTNIPVSVPCGSTTYATDANWRKFTNIQTVGNASVPYNLEVLNEGAQLKLQWKGEVADYKVYRNNTLIATVSTKTYTDNDIVFGNSYCYQIKVESANSECADALSNEVCMNYTAVNQIEMQHFKVYPNPATDRIFIDGDVEFSNVIIYDIFGREVLKSEQTNELNISNLPQGNYIANILN